MEITLPYKFEPRSYQLPFFKAFDSGMRRLVLVWHRRSGKDKTCLNLIAREMWSDIGNYYYLFPTYAQAKKAIWEGRGKDGVAYLDHFPVELRDGKPNETEMKIRYKNGSLFQLVGTEDVDKLVGTNPKGMVFSEYSLQNPKVWDYMRPILAENKGWAVFNFTPRGRNHGFELFEQAKSNEKWWVSKLSVTDTNVLTLEDIDEERRAGMTEEMIQQEFYCSFVSAVQGSIYWDVYNQADGDNHFKDVPYDPKLLVYTVWDLGKDDTNCIGFYQSNGVTIRKIDYLYGNRLGLPDWIKKVKEKPYVFGGHFAPHDIEVSDYSTSGDASRKELARSLGINFTVIPRVSQQEKIDAGRRLFNKLYVDTSKCAEFLKAIPQYQREYDEEKRKFKDTPLHDWTSHFADEHAYAGLICSQFSNMAMDPEKIEYERQEKLSTVKKDTGL